MEVVERARVGRVAPVRLADVHVVEAVPLEQHAAGRDVDLLDDPLDDLPVAGPADSGQICAELAVDRDQCRSTRRDQEFVQIALVALAGLHSGDLAIAVIDDHADTAAVAGGDLSLPPGQHRVAAIVLHPHVHRGRLRDRQEPDRLAVVVEQQGAVLAGARERRGEDGALLCPARRCRHGHGRGRQIGSRDERAHGRRDICVRLGLAAGCRGGRCEPRRSRRPARALPPTRPHVSSISGSTACTARHSDLATARLPPNNRLRNRQEPGAHEARR